MNLIRLAIPLVLGMVLLEVVWGAARQRAVYGFVDSLADLGCAVMSQVVGLAVTALTVGAYAVTVDALVPWRPVLAVTTGVWIGTFLAVDLGQYLLHRLSHRVNLLWACHAVHHSSEEFNYTVGLRNSSFHGFLLWFFFLPAGMVGVPWRVVAVCYGLNVLYQFWLHTRLVGRLGPFERVLNTPSHHRVHHGTDPAYLDRNFGGVLIVWDRLFGTFREESMEPTYGTTTRLASWNPIWANFHVFALMAAAWRRAPDLGSRLGVIFGPPERLGRPAPATPPTPEPRIVRYAAAHLVFGIAATLGLVLPSGTPGMLRLGIAVGVLVTLGVLGGLLDGRQWAITAERGRLAILILAGAALPADLPVRLGVVAVAVASLLLLGRPDGRARPVVAL
ncbi:MAG: sterol desaturase family protein [Gemmatimonadota bacterium]